jgi:hypothetical protein
MVRAPVLPGLVIVLGAWCAIVCACCAAAPPPPAASAAGKPPAPAAPAMPAPTLSTRSPQAVLADAVEATGGAAAWNAHKTAHFKIETVFQGMGMGGSGERFATRENKSLSVTEMTGLGTIREGTNGTVFWSQDPLQGLRLLDGAEREQARIEACWNPEMNAATLFAKLEVATEPGPGGKPLECVIATPKVGAPIHNCYDPATHLQALQTGIRATPQGDVPFRAVMRDWRSVGGIKIAFEAETQVGPLTLVVRIKSVTFDAPVDAKIFEPPAVK